MCSDMKKGSEAERSKYESTELTDFELFGNVSVGVCVQPKQNEAKNIDYTWRSPEDSNKEFIILLDDIAELAISINGIKTFVEGQIVNNQKDASNFERKRIFVLI